MFSVNTHELQNIILKLEVLHYMKGAIPKRPVSKSMIFHEKKKKELCTVDIRVDRMEPMKLVARQIHVLTYRVGKMRLSSLGAKLQSPKNRSSD